MPKIVTYKVFKPHAKKSIATPKVLSTCVAESFGRGIPIHYLFIKNAFREYCHENQIHASAHTCIA